VDAAAVEIVVGGTELADLGALAPVYAAVFAEAPYLEPDASGLQRRLPAHRLREGFAIAIARSAGGTIGFAYGYTGRPGQVWTDRLTAVLGPDASARLLDGHFELVELAVLTERRGSGIGAGLLDALLAARSEPRVLLQTFDGDTPAMRLYRRRGFVPVSALDGMPVLMRELP
jgi:ribosomal protein S18 acetylase RimI-like enzyme